MLRNLLLLGVSSLLALLGAEAICRVWLPYAGWRQFEDVGLGWSSREYQEFDPLAGPRRPGAKRLLFLGDSFLAGAGLTRLDARFPDVLEERLAGRAEVAVLASAGWGPDQELLALVQKGMAWRPDVVFLVFSPINDLANLLSNSHGRSSRKPYFVLGEDGALQLFSARGDPLDFATHRAQRPGFFQSYLLDLLRWQLRGSEDEVPEADAAGESDLQRVDPRYLRFHIPDEKPWELWEGGTLSWSPETGVNHVSAFIHEDFETNAYQWALFEAVLSELARVTRDGDAELVVMLLPVSFRPRDLRFVAGSSYEARYATPDGGFRFRAAEPADRLRRAAERAGVRFYDPSRKFLEAVSHGGLQEAVWPDPGDRHFSDAAHRLLAQILERDGLPGDGGAD